jgi:DNA processing protein
MNAIAPLPLLARLAGAVRPPPLTPAAGGNDDPAVDRRAALPIAAITAARPQRRAPQVGSGATLAGERLARARLARTARIGPVTFHEMLGHFAGAEAALEALPSLARRAGFATAPVPPPADRLWREAEALCRQGGRLVVWGDPDYPALLAQIPDAPPLLAAIGDLDLLARPTLAVVGARNASTNGRRLAAALVGDLGAAGVVVVSGLARGIDTAAHHAALDSGTVAVLAGGVDLLYPPENDDLYRAIASRGLLLSEAPLGAVPQARHFPRRNRIVSGLALGVLVIEAALQSGSLITARQAADQGRDVFAVPGSPLDPRSRGTNRLIRDGALLVETAADILAQLRSLPAAAGARRATRATTQAGAHAAAIDPPTPPADVASPSDGCGELGARGDTPLPSTPSAGATAPANRPSTGHRPPSAAQQTATSPIPSPVTTRTPTGQASENINESLRQVILDRLGPSPTPVDELIRECHVSAALVTAVLLDLELSGRVERSQGNTVVLI